MAKYFLDKKALLIISYYLFSSATAYSQKTNSLNIDSCYVMAQRNYPLVKQYALIEKSTAYSIDNVNKQNFPQFNIMGQATHQSDVTEIPIKLPNLNIEPLSKDQYRLYGEISQPITDLFTVKDQKEFFNNYSEIENQKIEVELYKFKERINNLFFGILLIDAQVEQTDLLKKDIQTGINKMYTAIANGIALKSSADNLKAELLKANQRIIELKSNKKGYAAMLSLFINENIDDSTTFIKPATQQISNTINRPELKLYDLQKKKFDVQRKLITAKTLPRFSLFAQGGLGRPALNMLSNDATSYYIGGVRLNWNITGFYTYKKDKRIIDIQQSGVDIQKDVFLFNTNLTLQQQNWEVIKAQELIETDYSIIKLRESINNTTKNQLEYGTATTNDYLTAVNAKDQAQQNLELHQIQLLMAQYNYHTTSGN
ncbi:MAG: TolC family protein [Bacteroidia bacterium]